jgi:hypothetical protein
MKGILVAAAALIAFTTVASAGDVEVNGVAISKAATTMEATQDIVEFRDGGDPVIRLIPASKRFAVCVVTQARMPVFDAELPVADTPDRFTIKTEDGREFARCLLAGLKVDSPADKRRYSYCLRCEDVTP